MGHLPKSWQQPRAQLWLRPEVSLNGRVELDPHHDAVGEAEQILPADAQEETRSEKFHNEEEPTSLSPGCLPLGWCGFWDASVLQGATLRTAPFWTGLQSLEQGGRFKDKDFGPGWCGSVDWVPAWEARGRQFYSQSGHIPGLQVKSPVRGTWEATTYWCFSPSLSPSLPL